MALIPFETFKEEITIFRAPKVAFVNSSSDFNFAYGAEQPSVDMDYLPQSGKFMATVSTLITFKNSSLSSLTKTHLFKFLRTIFVFLLNKVARLSLRELKRFSSTVMVLLLQATLVRVECFNVRLLTSTSRSFHNG